jgi:molecular chaperone DnaK
MVADAERHRDEDAQLRRLVDTRNELDAVANQVERRLSELGENVPVHEKARAEMLVNDAREAVKDDQVNLDRLRSLIGDLQGIYHGLAAAGSTAGTGGGAGPAPGAGQPGPRPSSADDDDVIDAEFTSS